MLKLKKGLAWLITLVMLAGVMPMTIAQASYEQLETKEGVTRIGVLSDTHLRTTDGSDKLISALGQFAAIDPNYAGLALVGDIIMQNGNVNNDYAVYTEPYEVVTKILADHAKDKPYFWSMGNHEFPLACVLNVSQSEEQTAKMQAAIETSKQYYTQYTGMQLDDDKTIGGYHFISADQIDYSNVMDAQGEEYMMERIDAAIAADGNEKPIFLALHKAPWYTTVSSTETAYDNPYSETFINYLANHPNVIVLTGHTHASEYLPQAIWNDGGYTVVNLGHTSNGSNVRSEGVMLEIENNVVRIRRMDFVNQEYIGEDWVLDIPNMVKNPGDVAYWKYTDARANAVEAPAFAADAVVTASGETESSATITFPQATGYQNIDDGLIKSYRIKVVNKKLQTLVQDYTVTSDYYAPPAKRAETRSATISSLNAGTDYEVQVSAISVWDKESEAISGTFSTTSAATDDDTTEEITVNSPEDDPRNPIYHYVVAKDASGTKYPNYKDVYSPGRNRKEVTADEDGNYPEGSFTANVKVDGVDVEKHFIDWFSSDNRFGYGGGFVTFYEAGNYVSLDFTVEEAGRYELMGIGANSKSSDMAVYIDGRKKGTFTVPVNNNGAYGPLYDGTYASAGEYLLEAGTYEIMFKLETQANSQLIFYGAALAKQADATIIKQSYKDSTTLIHGNNCTMYDGDVTPHTLVYENRTASFKITAPFDGTYDVYGVIGASKGHEFKVAVDGAECFTDTVSGALAFRKLNGQVPLTAGEHTFSIITGDGQPSFFALSEIMLVREGAEADWTWKRIIYNNKNTEITMNHANGSLDAEAFGMGDGCYAEYTIVPSETGVYSISHKLAGNSAALELYVNGELVSEFTHNTNDSAVLANATSTEPVSVVLVKGMTYDIMLIKVGGGNATAVYTDIELEEELSGGAGLYYDIYAGDSVADNYASQSADSLKYGTGHAANGWGCYGGLWAEYNFSIEYRGWYDLNLVLGAAGEAAVTVSVDGNVVATQNAEYVDGEDWTVKRDNDFGKVFLLEGDHTLKIAGGEGTFQIFKTRISFAEEDDGTAPIEFVYDSHSYTDKGGSNVQTSHTSATYNGVVLGEGNSYAEYTVDVPAGNYILSICYGASAWDGRAKITVNGGLLGTYSLPQNNTFIGYANYDPTAYYAPEVLSLNEGTNKIKIMCAQFKDSTGYAYFSYSTLKLTRVTTPEVLMYSGEYITPDGRIDALADGTVTLRNYLPTYVENKAVTVVACIYEDGRLYKVDTANTSCATVNDILISQFENISMDSEKTYTLKTFYIDELGNMEPLCESVPVV